MTQALEYLDYHVAWRTGAAQPGRHAARQGGAGGGFSQYRPFWQLPNARQIDVKRSVLNPFGQVIVRQTQQPASINVVLAADLSRSMQPALARSALHAISRLAEASMRSALRAGDGFGLVGFDTALRDDAWLAPTRSRAASQQMVGQVAGLSQGGRGADAIALLPQRLPVRRCLVLLVSDFLMPLRLIEAALTALARHDVAPIVLTVDTAAQLPRAGLLRVADSETGQTRLLLMRPSVKRRWLEAAAARRRALDAMFLQFCRPAFHATSQLDIAALSRHLVAG